MSTQIAAVIGSPVRHSLSPAIHNAAFAAHGDDWMYAAFEVQPEHATAAIDAMRILGIAGLSITMPHKEMVMAALDEVHPAAKLVGAVNTVVRNGNLLVGHNIHLCGCVGRRWRLCHRREHHTRWHGRRFWHRTRRVAV